MCIRDRFYPANPLELTHLVERFTAEEMVGKKIQAKGCLVPHAGYVYSGSVAGAVFSRIHLPKKILLLGVRHRPHGASLAIVSEGAWRTPLGDVKIHAELAHSLRLNCPSLVEDEVAHEQEHSLEVELPFLQVLDRGFQFVPVAIGTLRYTELEALGKGVARVLQEGPEEILVVTSSDMNHYADEETTKNKDRRAIQSMKELNPHGLYEVCLEKDISMCGLGPAIVMLTAMKEIGVKTGEVVRYATSGDVSGERDSVVGYVGMIFR